MFYRYIYYLCSHAQHSQQFQVTSFGLHQAIIRHRHYPELTNRTYNTLYINLVKRSHPVYTNVTKLVKTI